MSFDGGSALIGESTNYVFRHGELIGVFRSHDSSECGIEDGLENDIVYRSVRTGKLNVVVGGRNSGVEILTQIQVLEGGSSFMVKSLRKYLGSLER